MSLKIDRISKRHKDRWVLRDVEFEVSRGEIFGIFGPNGCGKDAILDAVLGTSRVTMGSIFYDDRDITKTNRRERDFSSIEAFERSSLGRLFGVNRSGGDDLASRLAGAIEGARNVLVIDENFCLLDPTSREDAVEKLRTAAHQKQIAVVLATNDFESVVELCDRAAVLVGGEIAQIGTPQEIYERPASRVVAKLTGHNNLFSARRLTSSKAEVPEFHTIDGGHRLFAGRIERGLLGALNQNVTLAIRPEHISLSFGASFPEDNLLKARVTHIRFRGATTLVGLDADGLKLDALVLRVVGLSPGDECMVGLPPDRILIFRD